ncbi:DinB family protein [Entophlyctis helioformis]|nr:DinB family protein [Entophlyctis helioformis]
MAKSIVLRFAKYNLWAYERLFQSLDKLSDAQFTAHAGLAFRSIKGTLGHLLVADELWYKRMTGKFDRANELGEYWRHDNLYAKQLGDAAAADEGIYWESVEADRSRLKERILAQAGLLIKHIEDMPSFDAEKLLVYKTSSGADRSQEFGKAYIHVVNHATHHRGQISAAVTRFGLDPPVMDLTYFDE